MAKTTAEFENELKSIRTSEELEKWIDINKNEKARFCDVFVAMCEQKGMKPGNLVGKIALSKTYIYAMANGEKVPSKDAVIKVALGLGSTVEETNVLLKLSGNKELYPKIDEDAVIEFGIQNQWDVFEIEELLKKRGLNIRLTDKG